MNRLTQAWFEFGDIRCDTYGVRMLAMPDRPHPAAKGELFEIPGRSGALWVPEDAFEMIDIAVSCVTEDASQMDAIGAWLNGRGDLRFSDSANRVYHARVKDSFKRGNRYQNFDAQTFEVIFTCDPLQYRYMELQSADDVTITTGNAILMNPGTYYSQPRLTIVGNGDAVLRIASTDIQISGMVGGIIIDAESMDCYNLSETLLMNGLVTMDAFPRLERGVNMISWDGGIDTLTIRPRWRYI